MISIDDLGKAQQLAGQLEEAKQAFEAATHGSVDMTATNCDTSHRFSNLIDRSILRSIMVTAMSNHIGELKNRLREMGVEP